MNRLQAYLRKDGWLLLSLLICVLACLLLGASGQTDQSAEMRISSVLSKIAGAGQVDVAFCYEDTLPCGAVVVADGADDIAVRLKLINAVTKLLGIDGNRVAIYPRGGSD